MGPRLHARNEAVGESWLFSAKANSIASAGKVIGISTLRHGPNGSGPRTSSSMWTSHRSRFNLNKIIILIIAVFKCCSWLYSSENRKLWTVCQLATCDVRRPRTVATQNSNTVEESIGRATALDSIRSAKQEHKKHHSPKPQIRSSYTHDEQRLNYNLITDDVRDIT
ncbi:hypothetical protein TNCV_3888851 [Trichonephila clavipes]|nr:hypothetical protein TNCV_3888851 [Trichonephila clavipes]